MVRFIFQYSWLIILLLIALVGSVSSNEFWPTIWRVYTGNFWLNTLLIFVVLPIAWHQLKWWLRYTFITLQAKKIQTFKVTLPRADSKIDQEKRTEKDFKERIGVMEQLYRALFEVHDLNIWQHIYFHIFRNIIISFELYIEDGRMTFYVATTPDLAPIVEKQITTYYPDADVSPHDTPELCPEGQKFVGYNVLLEKSYMYPIRYYDQMQDDPLNAMANVLTKLGPDERAGIQIVLTPTLSEKFMKKTKKVASQKFKGKSSGGWLEKIPLVGTLVEIFLGIAGGNEGRTYAPGAASGDSFVRMLQPEEELYKRMGEKAGLSFYHASIRIFASTPNWNRSIGITNDMQVGLNTFKDLYGNNLINRRMFIDVFPFTWNAPFIKHLWENRINGYFHGRCTLVEKELAGLFHFPDTRYNKMPNIEWLTYKVLPPPPDSPEEGVLLGNNVFRGKETPIRFLDKDRTRHHYIIGKSGAGKSAFISYMSRQDIARGAGVCIVDPHGDLVEDALAHTPKEMAKNVIVFNPADADRPMGLNLLEANTPEEKDRASLDAMEIFIKLFGNEIFGPRIQHYFRNGCLTLMDDEEEGATLIDVPRLFVDEEFQRYKVSKCKNVVVRSFWDHEMAKTGAREKEEMIPYFSSKFGPFITNTTMRNIIGQPKSAFNIREVMDNQKVLLVNLSKGKIGDTNAQLLGLIFVNKINMAAMSRADTARKDRKRFYLYVDEFQNFVTDAFATILSEARKYELGLIMAHQFIGQLVGKTESYGSASTKMRDAVFGNVGTISSFKIGAEDAEYMAKEMAPVLSEQDVIGIPNFSCYMKLNIRNVTSRPFSMKTIYDESDRNEKLAELIKEYSRMKYGRKKVFVDQEIEDRIGIVR